MSLGSRTTETPEPILIQEIRDHHEHLRDRSGWKTAPDATEAELLSAWDAVVADRDRAVEALRVYREFCVGCCSRGEHGGDMSSDASILHELWNVGVQARETCKCGAVFETTTISLGPRAKELEAFRDAHAVCRSVARTERRSGNA